MDINEIIDWLGTREDIVIADKEKFFADLREQFQEPDTKLDFIGAIKKLGSRLLDSYVNEGQGNHLLIIASNGKTNTAVWGVSIAALSDAFASFALEDEDYVKLVSNVSEILLKDMLFKRFNDDTD